MTVGSLFSGIGGFDLGFEAAGFRTVWFCEQNPFCQNVLRKHWPGVPIYDDVRTLRMADAAVQPDGAERPDVLCGGFPCQDVSLAGAQAGLDGNRSGLWFEFLRCIGEFRPRVVCVENVAGLFVHGFATVIGGLAALGYDAEWTTLRASDVGAPHRRERVFIIAYRVADRECSQDHALRGDCDCGWSAVGRGRQAAQRDDGQADTNSPFGCRPELADAEGLADRDERGRAVIGQSEPTWQQSAPRDESDGRGATVAHGTRGGQRIERTEARARDERHVDGGDTGLADTGYVGQQRREGTGREAVGRPEYASGRSSELVDTADPRSQGCESETGEGRIYGRLAGSTRWPSRPGEPQHDWEPSRTIASARTQSAVGAVSDGLPVELPRWRRSALEAIGNAIVPQCAEVVAWRVRELLEVTA